MEPFYKNDEHPGNRRGHSALMHEVPVNEKGVDE